jgi:uncharacterized protein (DUF433 family)
MAPTVTHKQHIERRDGVCGGKPCVVGTRIRVQDVYVWHELQGRSPEQIVTDFPQLTLADVHSALAYSFDHREEIERDMRDAAALVAAMKAAQGPGLLERLHDAR